MRVLGFAFLALLVSCSGLRGKADDLYQEGAYYEAIQLYGEVLREDPNDQKALSGLKRARTAYIDDKLIEVRMARFAGNQKLALDTLLEMVKLEEQWAYFPPGALAHTQEEESQEALQYVEGQVRASAKKERPLWGLYLLTHYNPIFSGQLAGRRDVLLSELSPAGKKQCNALARTETAKYPYYSGFVRKVCTAWGVPEKGNRTRKAKRETLYRGVRVASNIAGLPSEYRAGLASALERAFQQTPWFDAKGKQVLEIQLDGKFREDHEKAPEQRMHGYHVDVPYTEYENVAKKRQVPYTDYDRDCRFDPSSKRTVCTDRPVTKYREEVYNETAPVTRHRREPRYQAYDGFQHHQVLELRAEGALNLGRISKPLRIDGEIQREGFEHRWNLPGIGLTPEAPDLENPETWVKQQAELLGADLNTSAGEIWDGLYCQPMNSDPTLLATGDQVHRCLRHRHANPPAFADQWYERFFGLTVAQADELLRLSDL